MCTLHMFPQCDKSEHVDSIRKESAMNPDGISILCLIQDFRTGQYKASSRVQFMDTDDAVWFINKSKADYYVVHLRAATSLGWGKYKHDEHSVTGCHMFTSKCGTWVYAHNGIIRGKKSEGYHVDSLVIGEYDLAYAEPEDLDCNVLPYDFANVLAYHIPTSTMMYHRCKQGRLHMAYTKSGLVTIATHKLNDNYTLCPVGWRIANSLMGDTALALE